jgi:outer membrane protein assembly factor BamB
MQWNSSKNLLWKTALPGTGHSTPIIWGDRAFLTAANRDGSERFVLCIRTTDGKILWNKSVYKGPAERTHGTNTHASPSCVTDGERVYAFFGTPGLFCFDLNGKQLWHHSFGLFTSETGWGIGASPVLYENLVIQNCDNNGSDLAPKGIAKKDCAAADLVALDKISGKVVWRTPRNQGHGYSTPVVIESNGKPILALNGPMGVWAYDPKTGKELWHCYRHTDLDNNKFGEAIPAFNKDTLFAPAGRESGYLQAIKLDGSGDVTKSGIVWELPRKGIRDVGSGMLVGDYIYFADSRGATISAHDIKTGKQLFSERSAGGKAGKGGKGFYASPILLNGKVLCLRMDGVTFIVEPGPTLKIVGQNTLADGTDFSASPAVADGRLFLRSQTHLYCIATK